MTVEKRRKRGRALDALHSLRTLAHVVDLHQLAKDPSVVHPSPGRTDALGPHDLARYLDFCAEMLALIGKLAALYADEMRDSVVINAVDEVENLTANLAQKIWQKIMIIGEVDKASPGA
jgi:hypothetical protein